MGKKKKKPCLNLKTKMLMRFLFQKHILLIKSTKRYWLVGGPMAPALPAWPPPTGYREAGAGAPRAQMGTPGWAWAWATTHW